ncbi:UDP-galactopyranose mutase [Campylobacter molothri]|uniref:UDP-galactopyranose mutase n=1 Tax=Campylobacter molothri TaxID=1032242 RepID=UPI00301E54E5|nr:UDP-galactopyranose mutase [Campylobacter sp. RM10538]
MMKVQNLIVGSGLSGAVLARKIAEEKKEKVLIIDRRNHIGGNVYDYKDQETNITIHKYGPHVFHTSIKEVWDFLSRFTKWHYFYLKPLAFIDGFYTNLPFNINSIYKIFPNSLASSLEKKLIEIYGYNIKVPILKLKENKDSDINFVANYIYEKVFKNYTLKQWGLKPEEIDPNVTARVPIYISRDNGYFQDIYQGIPQDGYTKMIENIVNHPLIKVQLNTDFKDVKKNIKYEKLFYTGAIDEFFDYELGELPYRSLEFDIRVENKEFFQESAVVNYPNNYDFTRICEHKYFLDEKSNSTIISIEYPKNFQIGINERYYPINNLDNQNKYMSYLKMANNLHNVHFLGRLGDYKYYDMDKAVDRVLKFKI